MLVTLEEAKQYLRVDYGDDDEYLSRLIDSAEAVVKDAGRLTDEEFKEHENVTRAATLYCISYLYEHREATDMHELTLMLRSILFGVRREKF